MDAVSPLDPEVNSCLIENKTQSTLWKRVLRLGACQDQSSPIVHISSPAQELASDSRSAKTLLRRPFQTRTHVKTKVLQSFTQAPLDLAVRQSLSPFQADWLDRPRAHEWRTGLPCWQPLPALSVDVEKRDESANFSLGIFGPNI